MKKSFCFALILVLCLLLTNIAVPSYGAEDVSCHGLKADIALDSPGKQLDTANAVILYELNTGTMVYTYNADKQVNPTGLVKLLTVLVALEHGDLNEVVTVKQATLNTVAVGSKSARLKSGEEITLRDLLYCVMVYSANDACAVIAAHIGGNQEGFVAMMNDKAKALGCNDSHFTNAHGLHEEENYTTARDICRIADAALENDHFRAMFTAESYTVPATNKSEARTLWTGNHMMSTHTNRIHFDSRVTGGKTGATDQAGRCLVATAESGGMEIMTVLMGAVPVYSADGLSVERYGSFEETRVLLDFAFANYEFRQIFLPGQVLCQFPVQGGANSVAAGPVDGAMTVLPKVLEPGALVWQQESPALQAPVEAGQLLSTAQVWLGDICLAQTRLQAMHAVGLQQTLETEKQPILAEVSTVWKVLIIVGGTVVGLFLLLILALFTIRMIRRAAYNAKLRRRSGFRKRSR